MPAPLEVRAVDKRFGAVHAVRSATLAFERGAIHAVVGENGAGKSTLLKIAAGLVAPDAGEACVDGVPLTPHTPAEAIRRGVAMVQQHFALVDAFTALENIVLGVEPARGPFGRVDLRAARTKAEGIARELGAAIALDAGVATLGVGDKQRLEIARALYRDARVVICDEPTAVLTPDEAGALYATLRRLADAGRAVVVVTHKLDEVRDYADVATVMRHGEILETRAVRRTDADMRALSDAIMGANKGADAARAPRAHGEPRLIARGVSMGRALRGVTFDVRSGEIVGIAGVEGNGQRELVRAFARLDAIDAGEIAPGAGAIEVVHEDRHSEGLVLDATIRDNVLLGELARFARRGVLDESEMNREGAARVERAQAPRDLGLIARTLSGGNQQKLVLARAIARLDRGKGRGLVVAHPTRGVDVAASRAIHADILAAAGRGVAVLVVSADLHELRALSDRILVIARGRITAELSPAASDAEIGRAMLAVHSEAHA